MSRLTHLKHLFVAALGVGAVVVACHAAQPEAPPLAPNPDRVGRSSEPAPSAPKEDPAPSTPGSTFPATPGDGGAPNKSNPDMPATPMPNPMPKNNGPVTMQSIPTPELGADQYQTMDAGLRDAQKAQDAVPPPADANLPVDGARGDALLPPPPRDAGRSQP